MFELGALYNVVGPVGAVGGPHHSQEAAQAAARIASRQAPGRFEVRRIARPGGFLGLLDDTLMATFEGGERAE